MNQKLRLVAIIIRKVFLLQVQDCLRAMRAIYLEADGVRRDAVRCQFGCTLNR